MTDLRGTEQDLWDEEEVADEDRKTLSFAPPSAGHLPEAPPEPAARGEEGHAPQASPPSAAQAPEPPLLEATTELASVESVARFIAEPGHVLPSAERELDSPRRSLAALELLDADEGAESSYTHPAPLPPALPADVPRVSTPSEGLLLGPARSARGDVTERVTTIPRTHPMANSIAPGGSPLSTPPVARRRSLRWQAALGIAALLAIGVTSRLLQSRGEHHAASGSRSSEDDAAALEPRRSVPAPSDPGLAAQAAREAALQEAALRAASESAALMSVAPAQSPFVEPVHIEPEGDAVGSPARRAKPPSTAVAESSASRRMRVGVGGAQLIERSEKNAASAHALTPVDRGQIVSALSALTPRLQECVGDEHGIADVTLTVRAPGVVSHALVEGAYAGSDKGSCIARALRSAKLPQLAEPVARIEYPFNL